MNSIVAYLVDLGEDTMIVVCSMCAVSRNDVLRGICRDGMHAYMSVVLCLCLFDVLYLLLL